ncbi:hypothetical protein T03_17538, partial [Trichinella britovi]
MSGLSSYAAQKWLDHCCKRKGLQSNQQHRCCIRHRLGLNSSKSVLQLYSQINRLEMASASVELLANAYRKTFCMLI